MQPHWLGYEGSLTSDGLAMDASTLASAILEASEPSIRTASLFGSTALGTTASAHGDCAAVSAPSPDSAVVARESDPKNDGCHPRGCDVASTESVETTELGSNITCMQWVRVASSVLEDAEAWSGSAVLRL